MESEICKQRQSKRRKDKNRKIDSKEDEIKKEQEESSEEEDEEMNFRSTDILSSFQSNFVKNECEDSTENIDQSCITSSESTVEQFDQLDVNTGMN